MDKFRAVLKLTRIEHSIMLVIAVIAAELISGYIPSPLVFALSIITPIFVSMGSFAINDYFDVKADKINKRYDRPLVNGSITKKEALWIIIASFAIGVLASAFINAYAFVIALVFAVLAILYSYKLKDTILVGNIYIAFSMVIPFIYGNYVVTNALQSDIVLIGIVIFLAGLAREIHGMIRDYQGDKKARDSKNLVFHIGAMRSSQLAFLLYVEAIGISVYMFFFSLPFAYNLVYIIPIAINDLALIYIAFGYLMKKRQKGFDGLSRNLSLGMMALSLLAFLVSALVYIRI